MINPSDVTIEMKHLGKWPKLALVSGVVGLLITAALYFLVDNKNGIFFRGYLVGFTFWFNMAAGALFWLLVQHLAGGNWGVMIRRVAEAGAADGETDGT